MERKKSPSVAWTNKAGLIKPSGKRRKGFYMWLSAFLPEKTEPEARKECWEQEFVCKAGARRASEKLTRKLYPKKQRGLSLAWQSECSSVCPLPFLVPLFSLPLDLLINISKVLCFSC